MENFYLEKPSLKRKEEIIEYLKELDTYNSDINGIEMLYKIYEGYPFDEVLNNCLKRENEEYSKKINKCAIKTFLLIRKKDNRIIGAIKH
jgi:predicted acetyltransferase